METSKQNIVALIPARGGSKGIPDKNIKSFCNKPLIAWTIEQALATESIDDVVVTSDSPAILEIAEHYGANTILRPGSISGDTATTESAIIHALGELDTFIDTVVLLQATSPLRKTDDLEKAITTFFSSNYDSLFSGAILEDFLIWKINSDKKLESLNYNHLDRGRRQDREVEYVENGSLYIFEPGLIKENNNRLGSSIGIYLMDFWQSYEIDAPEDWDLLEILFKHYLLNRV